MPAPSSTKTPGACKPGDVVAGKYRIDRRLGAGGMGIVYAATHEQIGQKVAIKFMGDSLEDSSNQRFLREARACAQLEGEHVARILDYGTDSAFGPFLVMEYLKGRDFTVLLTEKGQFEVAEAVDWVLEACEALAEAHAAGIVHRDIKPGNLFLADRPDGTRIVKLLDFGLAKKVEPTPSENSLTAKAEIVGSPHYMAPEQIERAEDLDGRADIWAMGTVLYRMLSGTYAFDAASLQALCVKILTTRPAAIAVHRPDIPAELDAAVLRCLAREKDDRFGDVAELALAIAPFGTAKARESSESIGRLVRKPGFSATFPADVSRRKAARESLPTGQGVEILSRSRAAVDAKRVRLVGGAFLAGLTVTMVAVAYWMSSGRGERAPASWAPGTVAELVSSAPPLGPPSVVAASTPSESVAASAPPEPTKLGRTLHAVTPKAAGAPAPPSASHATESSGRAGAPPPPPDDGLSDRK